MNLNSKIAMSLISLFIVTHLMMPLVSSDTTVLLQENNTENLEDTFIRSGSGNSNFGSSTALEIAVNSESIYIMFNLSSIPSNAQITDSELYLDYTSSGQLSGSSSAYDYHVYGNTNITWIEDIITYNNHPASTLGSLLWSRGIGSAGNLNASSDAVISSFIESSLSSGKVTFYINETHDGDGHVEFKSKEHSSTNDRPYLMVTYFLLNVTIDKPINASFVNLDTNINLNFTVDNITSLDTCIFTTDNYVTNESIVPCVDTTFNRSDGNYLLKLWVNDSGGHISTDEVNFTVDSTFPEQNITNILTSSGSKEVTANFTLSDVNCNSSFYSVFKSDGSIDGSLSNITLDCSITNNATFTVSNFATYNLTYYVIDKADNENSTTKSFTVSKSVVVVSGGGGSSSPTETIRTPATNFSVVSTSFGNSLDFVLAKDSIKPRKRRIFLINEDIEPIDVNLVCDTTLLEESNVSEESKAIDICDYVTFESDTITISPNELANTETYVEVLTPENASFGDEYSFNILALQTIGDETQFSKLSVTARVAYWGIVLKYSAVPLQGVSLESNEIQTYPVALISLFIAFLIFGAIWFLFRTVLPATSFFLGFLFFVVTFISLIFIL